MTNKMHAAVCTEHGLIRWASSYADACLAGDQHHAMTSCYSHIRIEATR